MASLTVVFAHFVVGFYPALYYAKAGQMHVANAFEIMLSRTPLNLLYNGSFSVAVFFVLSGYVLTYKPFKDGRHEVVLLPLAVKRYIRLLLPVMLSVGLSYAVLSLNLYYHHPANTTTSNQWLNGLWNFKPDIWIMLRQAFYGVLLKREVTYNLLLWTMNFEFFGSLLVYVFVYYFRDSRKRYIPYTIGIVFFWHSYYLAFMLGMLLSDLSARQTGLFVRSKNQVFFMLLLITGIFIGSYPVELPVQGTIYAFLDGLARIRTYQILGAAFVMTAIIKLPWLQSLLSRGPLVLLGKISFSLYLLHVIIMGSLSNHLFVALTRHVSYLHAFVMTFLISLPVILAASYLAYLSVDRSSVRVSQWAYGYVLERTKSFNGFLSTRLPSFMKRGQSPSGAPCEEVTLESLPAEQGSDRGN